MPPLARSPFPPSSMSQVWLAVVAALQTDPILRSAVDTWQVWSNKEIDTAEPTDEDLPIVRITPAGGQGMWLDEGAHQLTWNIKIEIGCEGTDITNVLDFWQAIFTPLFNGNILLNTLYPYGVIQKTMSTAGVTPRMFGEKTGLGSEGLLTIKMRINS